MKHPALRVRWYGDVAPEVRGRVRVVFSEFRNLLPFVADDFAVTGSYARAAAELHSDLDVNIETGTTARQVAALAALKSDPDKFRTAMVVLRSLYREFGLRLDLSFESPSIKAIPEKSCYRILEDAAYSLTSTTRVVLDVAGVYRPRPEPVRVRPPKFTFGSMDDNGEFVLGLDRWAAEVDAWKLRYGSKLLIVGQTAETAHYG